MFKKKAALPTTAKTNVKDSVFTVSDICSDEKVQGERASEQSLRDEGV